MDRYGPEQPPAPKGSGWHFLSFAALTLATVVGLAGWGPALFSDVRVALDEREWARRIEPARLQVTKIDPPAGARPCEHTQAELDTWGQVCWHQVTDVQPAVADVRRAWERVGAMVLETECVKDPEGLHACLLYGELEGSPFILNAFRPALPGGGRSSETRVTGGLDGVRDYPRLFERILPAKTARVPGGWWGGYEPGPLEVFSVPVPPSG